MRLPLVGAALLALCSPVLADHKLSDWTSPEEAMQVMTDHDWEVLGVLPCLGGKAVYYEGLKGVYAAPINEEGCVAPFGIFVPDFTPPVNI